MKFKGISREFSLVAEGQYQTIGAFWDEMALLYGLENLRGLGYSWDSGTIGYAIGLKSGDIEGFNLSIVLPDSGWTTVHGKTDELRELYDEIYKNGALTYEIEEFFESGDCVIQ